MKNKGFTLIEVIAVVVIISIISLIILPNIINQYANKKEQISDTTKKIILNAAELYAAEKNLNYGSILLNDLVKDEKIEAPLKDHKSGKEIPLSIKIYIDNNGNACLEGDEGCQESTKPDTTPPTDNKPSFVVTTNKITVTCNQKDTDGKIEKKYYSIKKATDSSWGSWKTSNVFTNLKSNTQYQIRTKAVNKVGLSTTSKIVSVSTKTLSTPTIALYTTTGAISGNNWVTSKTYKITYTKGNIETPYYYLKPTVAVTSSVSVKACGTGTKPSGCSATTTQSLSANTWYLVSNTTVNITFKKIGSIVAMTTDDLYNYNSKSSSTVTADYITGTTINDYATSNIKYKLDYNYSFSSKPSIYTSWTNLVNSTSLSVSTTSGWNYSQCSSSVPSVYSSSCSGARSSFMDIKPGLYFDGVDDRMVLGSYEESTVTVEVVYKAFSTSDWNMLASTSNGGGFGLYPTLSEVYIDSTWNCLCSTGTTMGNCPKTDNYGNMSYSALSISSTQTIFMLNSNYYTSSVGTIHYNATGSSRAPLTLGTNPANDGTPQGGMFKGYIYAVRVNKGSLGSKDLSKNNYIDRVRYGF